MGFNLFPIVFFLLFFLFHLEYLWVEIEFTESAEVKSDGDGK